MDATAQFDASHNGDRELSIHTPPFPLMGYNKSGGCVSAVKRNITKAANANAERTSPAA